MIIKEMNKKQLKFNIEMTKRKRKALIKQEKDLEMKQILMEIKFMKEENNVN